MDNTNLLLEMFDSGGWVRYNKTVARELGIESAISLGNLIDKHIYWKNRGVSEWFHTRDDIEFETGLTAHQQRKGEKKLTELGLISIVAKSPGNGICKRINYYKIHFDVVAEFLNNKRKSLKSLTTAESNCEPLVVDRFDGNKNKDNKNKDNKNKINNIPRFDVVDKPQNESSVSLLESKGEESNIHTNELESNKSSALNNKLYAPLVNIVPALELEVEDLSDDLEPAPPLKTSIDKFIELHKKTREKLKLSAIKNYGIHIENLENADDEIVDYFIEDEIVMMLFFEYCDDRSYNWEVRHYECNSDRSPTVMVNESIFYRFEDWIRNNLDELKKKYSA